MKSKVRRSVLLLLFERQDGLCCYCGRPVIITGDFRLQQRPDAATVEHLRRRAEGGKNNTDNLACACRRCNQERGAMDWLAYTTFRRGEFIEFMAVMDRR
ncbi:MAG: HNH endonuclease [Shinella sp.]|nr:HNH endonuclease [Shinella sp.]